MYDSSAPLFKYVLSTLDILLVIMARIFGLTIMLPPLSGKSFPMGSKIGFSFIVATVIFTTNFTELYSISTYSDSFIKFGMLMALEFIVGFTIAFAMYMFFTVVFFAGQLIDFNIGFSMVSVSDPVSQTQAPVTGNFFYFVILVFFIQIGGLHLTLDTFFDSYNVLPIGSANLFSNANIPILIITSMSNYFVLGLRIALPITGTIMVINIALGILVKANPQMNIFVVGMPVKLIAGTVLLYFFIPGLEDMFLIIFEEGFILIKNIIKGMG